MLLEIAQIAADVFLLLAVIKLQSRAAKIETEQAKQKEELQKLSGVIASIIGILRVKGLCHCTDDEILEKFGRLATFEEVETELRE